SLSPATAKFKWHMNRTRLIASAFVGLLILANRCFAWDYGNGRHGSIVLGTNATIAQLYQAVRLANDPLQYDPSNSNAIPNFQNLTITNATLSVDPWNGTVGGIIAFKVEANLNIAANSQISVVGFGYRGGSQQFGGQFAIGMQGESFAGTPTGSVAANSGGGGGVGIFSVSNGHPNYTGTGAGGGYGGGGASSINNFCNCGAIGGGTYGNPAIDTLYLGSGGGGSQSINGGNGGGAISIAAGNIELGGSMHADGSSNGDGGGSGGSIKLMVASAVLATNQITANGGGGTAPGGDGRIAIYYAEGFTGVTTPTAYMVQDTNSDNVIVISNQPATQTNFLGANIIFKV